MGEKIMAEKVRGKGVITGIAMGKIMLAGQNLDGYLGNYKPEDKDVELRLCARALSRCARTTWQSRPPSWRHTA